MLDDLGLYSDRFFMAAVGVYVLAMILHGAEYAAQRAATPALVGADGPDVDEKPHAGRGRAERYGRMAVSLVVLGAALQLCSIALRGLAAGRWPLGNMYEFTSMICLAAVVGWLVVLRRSPAMRPWGCSCCCRWSS
jgi:hypothetical protein